MSDPTALLLSLLIGVVGAAVGVVGLLAVQGWQLKVGKDQAKAASRLIYLEITYNVSVLEATARIGTGGVPQLVSSQLWQQHSGTPGPVSRVHRRPHQGPPFVS
jgi:hypothetical protein